MSNPVRSITVIWNKSFTRISSRFYFNFFCDALWTARLCVYCRSRIHPEDSRIRANVLRLFSFLKIYKLFDAGMFFLRFVFLLDHYCLIFILYTYTFSRNVVHMAQRSLFARGAGFSFFKLPIIIILYYQYNLKSNNIIIKMKRFGEEATIGFQAPPNFKSLNCAQVYYNIITTYYDSWCIIR